MEFLTENWNSILAAIIALTSVANAITTHYSASTSTWVRVLGKAIEWLSFLTSKGVAVGAGPLKKVKLPGQDVK